MNNNIKLATELLSLLQQVDDNFSLFDGIDEDYKKELKPTALARICKITAQLNSMYNGEDLPLKSSVEIAEEYHRMTQEEFTTICKEWSFSHIGFPKVEYDGEINTVIGVRQDDGLLRLPNHIGWQNFDSCKLIK